MRPRVPAFIHHREKSATLMFPRTALNFIRNGYFPTDEPTLERALSHWRRLRRHVHPRSCAGEGVAIAKPLTPSRRERVQASPSSTTPSAPATHGNWSIAASKVT